MPAMPLFNEHSTACPITPANPSPQVLEIVAVESGQGACPQTEDFGQAEQGGVEALRKVICIHRKAIPGGLFAALYFLAHQTPRRTMRFGDDSPRADVRRILSPRFRLR